MSFQIKKILENQEFSINSNPISIKGDKTYKASMSLVGIEGKPKSAYFTVILWDSPQNEIVRYKKWIDDFSGKSKNYSIIFKSPKNAYRAFIGLRVNQKTPNKSNTELKIPDFTLSSLEETFQIKEQYDDVEQTIPTNITLSYFDEEILEKNIVWIFATARSGTTWLGTQLLKSDFTVPWHEPYIGNHFALLTGHLYRPEYFFSNIHRQTLLPLVKKLILHRAFSHANSLEKIIVIKEPNGVQGSDLILESMPKSKLIFLIRDGRDVVDSLIDAHQKDSWNKMLEPISSKEERLSKIEQYSKGWVNAQNLLDSVFQKHNSELRILVYYEKLRTNTLVELQKIYEFLKIKLSSLELNEIIKKYEFESIPQLEKGSGKFTRSASPGKWKENFSKEEIDLMNSIMESTLKKFGYEV